MGNLSFFSQPHSWESACIRYSIASKCRGWPEALDNSCRQPSSVYFHSFFKFGANWHEHHCLKCSLNGFKGHCVLVGSPEIRRLMLHICIYRIQRLGKWNPLHIYIYIYRMVAIGWISIPGRKSSLRSTNI